MSNAASRDARRLIVMPLAQARTPPMLTISVPPRLELIAAAADVTSREASGAEDWYAPLRRGKPEAWPPPFNDEWSQTWFARRIAREGTESGWLLWYVVRRPDTETNRRVLIGNGGFTGAPDARGSVEIGYSLLPSWQRTGLWHRAHCSTRLVGVLARARSARACGHVPHARCVDSRAREERVPAHLPRRGWQEPGLRAPARRVRVPPSVWLRADA